SGSRLFETTATRHRQPQRAVGCGKEMVQRRESDDRPRPTRNAGGGIMNAHRAILEEDASLPLVHVAVAFKRGATIDPTGKEGASRLLLRLMRRSVQGVAPEALDEKLDALGATLS